MVSKLNTAILKTLAKADVKKKISEQGAEVYSETPEQFSAFIQKESVKWGKVVREAGASVDWFHFQIIRALLEASLAVPLYCLCFTFAFMNDVEAECD